MPLVCPFFAPLPLFCPLFAPCASRVQRHRWHPLELFEKSDETYSVRDLAALLGISHQRVQQILTDVRRGVEVG